LSLFFSSVPASPSLVALTLRLRCFFFSSRAFYFMFFFCYVFLLCFRFFGNVTARGRFRGVVSEVPQKPWVFSSTFPSPSLQVLPVDTRFLAVRDRFPSFLLKGSAGASSVRCSSSLSFGGGVPGYGALTPSHPSLRGRKVRALPVRVPLVGGRRSCVDLGGGS